MKKPFQSYNGGKEGDGTYQKIINSIPPHDIYIEAFLGNGAIFRHKKAAYTASIGIDLDTEVISQWNKINPAGITLINTDAITWLENFSTMADIFKKLGIRVFIYLDPPYPKGSIKSQYDLYSYVMTDQEHTKLLSVTSCINADIMISSYPNQLYQEKLTDWNTFTYQSATRQGPATEQIWMNYPEPKELHDYRYLGNDYREREQLKGIIYRNVSKFKRLPIIQRNAIIQELKKEQIL